MHGNQNSRPPQLKSAPREAALISYIRVIRPAGVAISRHKPVKGMRAAADEVRKHLFRLVYYMRRSTSHCQSFWATRNTI